MSVSIDQLADEITKELRKYTTEVKRDVADIQKEIAQETAKALRNKRKFKNVSKNYYKTWLAKKVGKSYFVHNTKHYQLTHLLEKGHAKVNGGRVPAYPHIGPVEEVAIAEYLDRVERTIQS